MSVGTWADLEEELRATGHTLHPRAHGYEVRRHGERVAVLADDLSALRSTVASVRARVVSAVWGSGASPHPLSCRQIVVTSRPTCPRTRPPTV